MGRGARKMNGKGYHGASEFLEKIKQALRIETGLMKKCVNRASNDVRHQFLRECADR